MAHEHEISDTLDFAIITIVRQALDGEINAGEATKRIRRAQRLAQVARYQVPLANYQTQDLGRVSRLLGLEL